MSHSLKKIWNAVSTVLVALVVLLAVALVGVRLVGLNTYVVLSGSMEPTYHTGSLLYVKSVDPQDLRVGDPITFMLNEDTVATHRIIEILPDEEDSSVLRFRITFAKNTNWIQGADGYYYYQLPVDPQVSTGVLIEECELLKNASVPDGYHLSVEIVASAIQSAPDSVVQSMWHVTVEDGKITSANGSEVMGE